jgi:ATP-binding cassette subfamily D (ALD) protein 3
MHFHDKYMQNMSYYKITALDSRISNPDQRLTTDIEKWSTALSNFYSNFTKPILDIVMFSNKLKELIGWQGPALTIVYYFVAGFLIKTISPAFSKMYAQELRLEGQYRQCHSDILAHSEEIAFYNGHDWEKAKMERRFSMLLKHARVILHKRMLMGILDSMLVNRT